MFSENQSRQFYVVGTVTDPTAQNADEGSIQFKTQTDGDGYFLYKGPYDGLQRTDRINKCNVISITATDAASMAHKPKQAVVTFASGVSVIPGQVYVLNVNIHSYLSMDYNTTLNKFGAFKANSNTTTADILQGIATSLQKNFDREPIPYVTVTYNAATTSNNETVPANITIEEVRQPWRLGAAPEEFVNFTAEVSTVYNETTKEDEIWNNVAYGTSNTTWNNGRKLADMEWFYHKERGDVYGQLEWPNNIDTKLQISDSTAYDVIDIHYYYEGNSHNIGHSEKTITLAGATHAQMKSLLTSLSTFAGADKVTKIGTWT